MTAKCPDCQAALTPEELAKGVCPACGKAVSAAAPQRKLSPPWVLVVWAIFWVIPANAYSIIGVGSNPDFMVIQPGESPEAVQERSRKRDQERKEKRERHQLYSVLGSALFGGLAGAIGSLRAGYLHWLPLAWGTGTAIGWLTAATDVVQKVGDPLIFGLMSGLISGTMIGLGTMFQVFDQRRLRRLVAKS